MERQRVVGCGMYDEERLRRNNERNRRTVHVKISGWVMVEREEREGVNDGKEEGMVE